MVGMTAFDESLHPRSHAGQFSAKRNDAPAQTLDVPITDPFSHQAAFPIPDADRAVFVGAATFREIDDLFIARPRDRGYTADLTLRWAGIARGRELRAAGDAGIPTSLPEANPFAHTQNDVELFDMFTQITEEPPGDGEMSSSQWTNWVLRITEQYGARRAELVHVGILGAYRI